MPFFRRKSDIFEKKLTKFLKSGKFGAYPMPRWWGHILCPDGSVPRCPDGGAFHNFFFEQILNKFVAKKFNREILKFKF